MPHGGPEDPLGWRLTLSGPISCTDPTAISTSQTDPRLSLPPLPPGPLHVLFCLESPYHPHSVHFTPPPSGPRVNALFPNLLKVAFVHCRPSPSLPGFCPKAPTFAVFFLMPLTSLQATLASACLSACLGHWYFPSLQQCVALRMCLQ